MPQLDLERALKDLPRTGKLVKDRAYRQVWRFEHAGRAYYLKFYPAGGWRNWFRRRFRGSPAMWEFLRLQWLQKAAVPAPRAVAALMGFTIQGRKGDALVLEALEPSVSLDTYLHQFDLQGEAVPDHLHLVKEAARLLEKLGRAGLGHDDLHLGNILKKEDKLYLLDAYAVHKRGLCMDDIFLLAYGMEPYATRADLHRAWQIVGEGAPMPRQNRRQPTILRNLRDRMFRNDRFAGHLKSGPWSGHFFKQAKYPKRWSMASRLNITEKDWQTAWPLLLQQIESDQFEVLKRSPSGDVLAGELILGGRPVPVVIKRPKRKYWRRYITDIFRGTRARRAWTKGWELVLRNVPTAWPLLLMEKRCGGYVTDALLVCERIPGKMLAAVDAAADTPERYHQLLHRCGRTLRRIEETGRYLYDAKAENWIIRDDEKLGLVPMVIDMDGLLQRPRRGGGLKRLLRSLRENPRVHFTDADALALVRGYAPFATAAEIHALAGIAAVAEPAPSAMQPHSAEGGR